MKFVDTESICLILFGCGSIVWHQTWASGRQMLFEIHSICSTMSYGRISRIHDNVADIMICLALCRNCTNCLSCTYNQMNLQCAENTMLANNQTMCETNLKYSQNLQCERSGAFSICGPYLYSVPGEIRGYVEATIDGVTGSVCYDGWGYYQNAKVVCKSFGYSDGVNYDVDYPRTPSFYNGSIVMDEVQCLGTESSLLECPFATIHDCIHWEDVEVRCMN